MGGIPKLTIRIGLQMFMIKIRFGGLKGAKLKATF